MALLPSHFLLDAHDVVSKIPKDIKVIISTDFKVIDFIVVPIWLVNEITMKNRTKVFRLKI